MDESDLHKLERTHVCAECGSELVTPWSPKDNAVILVCSKDRTHQGYTKIMTPTEAYRRGIGMPIEMLNKIEEKERRKMEEKYGKDKVTTVVKYQSTAVITRGIAEQIVETLWGEAPKVEKAKAIMICSQYNLNPLMRHLYLVKYNRRNAQGEIVGTDWSAMLGIGATRLIAHRKHNFTYLDLTPRIATQDELDKALGNQQEQGVVYAITKIKDMNTGAEAYGIGSWALKDSIKGADKGNSALNMACIRSERKAIDRLYPGEMPGLDVVDETYVESPEIRMVNGETGEIKDATLNELKAPVDQPPPEAKPEKIESVRYCPIHAKPFAKHTRQDGKVWYSHKLDDGSWCNESAVIKSQKEAADREGGDQQKQKPKRDPESVKTITQLFFVCEKDFGMDEKAVLAELNVNSREKLTEIPAKCYERIAAVRPK